MIFVGIVAMEGAGRYIDFGVFHISVANGLIVLVGLALFVAALVVPFPRERRHSKGGGPR